MEVKSGYKLTEVGAIPVEWDIHRLGECVRKDAPICYGILMPGEHCDSGVPVVKVRDIIGGKIDESNLLLTHPSIDAAYQRSRLLAGDLLVTIRGTTGRVGIVPDTLNRANITQDTARLRLGNKVTTKFCYYILQTENAQFQITLQTVGQAVKGINIRDVRGLKILTPPSLTEQEAITEALSDADALIESLERLAAKKRLIKQGAMQSLLTGKTRLPGFSGKWETKLLGEICEIGMGRTPARLNQSFWGEGFVWLSIADLKGKVVSESKEQITSLATEGMKIIPKGTLLMSFKLSLGRLCFSGCDLYTNEAICSFINLTESADFLYYILGRTDFSLYGKQAVKGYTLNKESLENVEVLLPPLAEQTAIATVLSDMDADIAAMEAKLAKARQLKQGMMQELLTGRIRLV